MARRPPYIMDWHWTYGHKKWNSAVMYGYFPVPIYKDITGQYTDEECDEDNCVEIPVPDDLLWQWWSEENPEGEDSTPDDLSHWVYSESTCDDTIYLLDWLNAHGYFWKRLD